MRCEGVQDILSEYIDGEIAEPLLREAVEEHLRACAACRALAAELRDVQKAVHSLLTVTAPKEMVAQVAKGVEGIAAASGIPVQEIQRAESQLLARRHWRRFAWPVMMAAAATLLGVFVVVQVGTILEENRRSGLDERMKIAEAPPKDRLSVSNVPPTDTVPKPAFAGAQNVPASRPEASKSLGYAAAKEGRPAEALAGRGLAMKAPQPSASAPALPAAPPPAAAQQAPTAQVVGDMVARGQAQVQAQAAPREQRQVEEPARLEERIPPQVAKQLPQPGPGAGVAGKGWTPANVPAPSAAPEAKAGAQYAAKATEAAPLKGLVVQSPVAADAAKKMDEEIGREERQVVGAVVAQSKAAEAEPVMEEATKALTGKAESKTLTLRAQDIPAATAEVKEILIRNGAQLSRDYYAGGGLEGAGARLNARLPASRYPSVLTELREKDYLAPESAKPLAKARKAQAAAKPSAPPDVIDLAIRFQASAAGEAAPTAK